MYYIVRHGETEKNKTMALQGRSDMPLNATGREQAKKLGEFFAKEGIVFDEIYSSPLVRAVETAELAAGVDRNSIVLDDRLLEMDYGPYEGISLENPPKEIIEFFSDFVHNPAPEGMESLESVTSRMGDFVESISGRRKKNVLISAHAISMKGALEYLTPEAKGMYWSKNIANCEVYCFSQEVEGLSIPIVFYAEN